MLRLFRNPPKPWKGAVAGLAGGLAATIVMSQFQALWSKAAKAAQPESNSKKNDQGEDATVKAAGKVAKVAGRRLSRAQKKRAAPYIHYGFGGAMGAAYGVVREFAPLSAGILHPLVAGGGYGTALFLGADEVAVPALGLSAAPEDSPASSHLYGWASHLVYGFTLEMVRRTVRRAL